MHPMHDFTTVEVPPGIVFSKIIKELGTRGKVWVFTLGPTAVLSQRAPPEKYLNAFSLVPAQRSSIYRLIRGEQSKIMSGWQVRRFSLDEVDAINAFLVGFRHRWCIVSQADQWLIKPQLPDGCLQSESSQSFPETEFWRPWGPMPVVYSPGSARRGAAEQGLPIVTTAQQRIAGCQY